MAVHGVQTLPFWLAMFGILVAWYLFLFRPRAEASSGVLRVIHKILEEKYFLDRFNEWFFAGGVRSIGQILWRFGDARLIDGIFVNGSAALVNRISHVVRLFQSGYVYHYAFVMILGVFGLVSLWLFLI
jgi:NADH-quinone oxidoreductase subunit L